MNCVNNLLDWSWMIMAKFTKNIEENSVQSMLRNGQRSEGRNQLQGQFSVVEISKNPAAATAIQPQPPPRLTMLPGRPDQTPTL